MWNKILTILEALIAFMVLIVGLLVVDIFTSKNNAQLPNEIRNEMTITQDSCVSITSKKDAKNKISETIYSKSVCTKQPKDEIVEKYVQWACMIADGSAHGYSQGAVNATDSHPYTGSREGPDFDCASLVYF